MCSNLSAFFIRVLTLLQNYKAQNVLKEPTRIFEVDKPVSITSFYRPIYLYKENNIVVAKPPFRRP